MRISDWSSDVCSSDLNLQRLPVCAQRGQHCCDRLALLVAGQCDQRSDSLCLRLGVSRCESLISRQQAGAWLFGNLKFRSEEHTSELQSLMRISYAVFCLTNKITITNTYTYYRV